MSKTATRVGLAAAALLAVGIQAPVWAAGTLIDATKANAEQLKAAGKAVIGMKILGQGDLRHRVDDAIRYALSLEVLDAFTIGAESKREQQDLITRIAAA